MRPGPTRGLALLTALTVLLAACGGRAPDIEMSARYDLGAVRLNEPATVGVLVRNRGAASLTLSEIATDCGCTVTVELPANIPPGGEVRLPVECDPSHPEPALGRSERSIYITSDDPDEGDLTVTIVMDVVE